MIKRILFYALLPLSSCANTENKSDLKQGISKQKPEIIMYTSQMCGYCQKAKEIFDLKKIDYKEIDVAGNAKLIDEMEQKTGKRTVPQIMVNGQHIGSYKDLVISDMFGGLDETLKG